MASFVAQRRTKAGQSLDVLVSVTALTDDSGHLTAVATTEREQWPTARI